MTPVLTPVLTPGTDLTEQRQKATGVHHPLGGRGVLFRVAGRDQGSHQLVTDMSQRRGGQQWTTKSMANYGRDYTLT